MTNTYYGIYQGIVTNVEDPEKRGRLRCKIPKVLGDTSESAWCDPMIPVSYDDGGDFCMPPVKEAVWVQFIEGDVNRPVWCGGWWMKNKSPLGDTYSNLDDTRIISYKDCKIEIHKDSCVISNSAGKITLANGGITIESSGAVTIKGASVNLNP